MPPGRGLPPPRRIASHPESGATYHPLDARPPARHPLRQRPVRQARRPTRPPPSRSAGRGGVPADATAVTGNLTVTGSSAGWAVYLGPDPIASPTSSTINFTKGEVPGQRRDRRPRLRRHSERHLHVHRRGHDRSRLRRDRLLHARYVRRHLPPDDARPACSTPAPATACRASSSANTPATFRSAGRGGVPAERHRRDRQPHRHRLERRLGRLPRTGPESRARPAPRSTSPRAQVPGQRRDRRPRLPAAP